MKLKQKRLEFVLFTSVGVTEHVEKIAGGNLSVLQETQLKRFFYIKVWLYNWFIHCMIFKCIMSAV